MWYWEGNLSPHFVWVWGLGLTQVSYLGSFFLDLEDVRILGMRAIWNFAKGTGLVQCSAEYGAQRACLKAQVHQAWKGLNPHTILFYPPGCRPPLSLPLSPAPTPSQVEGKPYYILDFWSVMSINWCCEPLRTMRPIYRTGVPLPSRCCILYIFFQQV
jgi:hypothetical protein